MYTAPVVCNYIIKITCVVLTAHKVFLIFPQIFSSSVTVMNLLSDMMLDKTVQILLKQVYILQLKQQLLYAVKEMRFLIPSLHYLQP